MVNAALIDRLWALLPIAESFAMLWDRKAVLESSVQPLRPVTRFGARRAMAANAAIDAHNDAIAAEHGEIVGLLDEVRARYAALGGTALFPAEHLRPETVKAAAMALEAGRAVTVRGALEVVIADRGYALDAASQRRIAERQRASAARMRRAAEREAAMNSLRTQWAVQDAARDITRRL